MKFNREVLADICSVFQDFADRKNLVTTNPEKEKAMSPDNQGVQPTTIYGPDWDSLMNDVEDTLGYYDIEFEESYE